MRTRCRFSAVALGLSAFGAVLGALFLIADQSAVTRRARIDATTAEVRRGNYFAWGQVWMWVDKLSATEKNALLEACAQYARTNGSLHVTNSVWPPEKCSPGMQPLADWMRRVAGFQDIALTYDEMLPPPFPEIQARNFEAMYLAKARVAP